jgi:hypothetical protein
MIIYFKNPDTGLIEGMDESGKVITVQKSLDLLFDHSTKSGFKEVTRPNGETYWVEDGLEVPKVSSWYYNPMLAAAICTEVASGKSITKICKGGDYPSYPIIARWLTVYPEFRKMMDQAEKDRAYLKFEEIEQTVDEMYTEFKGDEDNGLAAAKLKIESLKFLVEKGDKDKFGTKPPKEAGGGLTIIVDTGIRREPIDVTPKAKELE